MSRLNIGYCEMDSRIRIKDRRNSEYSPHPGDLFTNFIHYPKTGNFIEGYDVYDQNPRTVLKKLLKLLEMKNYEDCEYVINKLSTPNFRIFLSEFPLEIIYYSLPGCLPLLNCLLRKALDCGENLPTDMILCHIARVFNSQMEKNLSQYLTTTLQLLPTNKLKQKIRTIDKTVQGQGMHGLIGNSDETLVNLHEALRAEFKKVVDTYKAAISKVDEVKDKVVSHQRLLAVSEKDIQDRVIKNKSILNTIESIDRSNLDVLLAILTRRINSDKEALFEFTELKKMKFVDSDIVASNLLRYSNNLKALVKLITDEDDSSDLSGYHSDSSDTLMTSGNSPFFPPSVRSKFVSRSVRCKNNTIRPSILAESEDNISKNLRPRQVKNRAILHKNISNASSSTTSSESDWNDCVTLVSVPDNQVITQGLNVVDKDILIKELRDEIRRLKGHRPNHPSHYVDHGHVTREYGSVYAQARVATMDALDDLYELDEADELKSKLLFSVIILSFRSVLTKVNVMKTSIGRLLNFHDHPDESGIQVKLMASVTNYFKDSKCDIFIHQCVQDVSNQLWSTLYDYPCLKQCEGLLNYITTCVKLSWTIHSQTNTCRLEYETKMYDRNTHVRFHSSDPNSEFVKTYLWPALFVDGICVHKGVVIT